MKSKIMILTLVGLSAGAFGTVGSRILAASDTPAPAGDNGRVIRDAGLTEAPGDVCRGLARKVSEVSISDVRLKRLLKKNSDCPAVVIDSKTPGAGTVSGPRIVTIAARTSATAPTSQSVERDGDFGEDEHEEEPEEESGTHFEVEHEEDD